MWQRTLSPTSWIYILSRSGLSSSLFIIIWGEALHVNDLAYRSNVSRQILETSGIGASKAQPSTREAASPWQGIWMRHHDNLGSPPSLGVRILPRKAPGMQEPCLNGRDTFKPKVRGSLSPSTNPCRDRPTHPILQPSSNVIPCPPG